MLAIGIARVRLDRSTIWAVVVALALISVFTAVAQAQTLDRIRETGKIRLGYEKDARPFSFEDDTGKPRGYAISLFGPWIVLNKKSYYSGRRHASEVKIDVVVLVPRASGKGWKRCSMAISPASCSSARRRRRSGGPANANSPVQGSRGVKCWWLRGPATAFICSCSLEDS
jgi:hypothetical protein